MSAAPLRLGLAGLGTVGIGVVKIVQAHADLIAARAGRPVVITAVSTRDAVEDSNRSGATFYILKTQDPEEILSLLKRVIEKKLCKNITIKANRVTIPPPWRGGAQTINSRHSVERTTFAECCFLHEGAH